MLDLAGFRTLWPEFAGVSDAIVNTALTDAAGRLSPVVYGNQINRAHGLLAAHIAVTAPWGHAARLTVNAKVIDGQTIYSKALAELKSERGGLRGIT